MKLDRLVQPFAERASGRAYLFRPSFQPETTSIDAKNLSKSAVSLGLAALAAVFRLVYVGMHYARHALGCASTGHSSAVRICPVTVEKTEVIGF